MTRLNYEKVNAYSKVQGSNPAMPPQKKRNPQKLKTVKADPNWVEMKSKFDSKCSLCKQKIKEGSKMYWHRNNKKVVHKGCADQRLVSLQTPKIDKKGRNAFIAPNIVRGWRDIA